MKLTNNTILITGGSNGIGFELAKQLFARGNKVVVTGRDAARLEKAKKALPEIHAVQSDVAVEQDIKKLFDKVTAEHPDLNIVINNAGIMNEFNLHDTSITVEKLTREIQINLIGTIAMVKYFLPHLKQKPEAAICNVSSGLAFVPLPTSPIYCSTKAAIHSYTQSLRAQLKRTNIKVFELAPPATETDILAGASEEDMKGIAIMKVEEMVAACLKGMEKDQFEIRPGQANGLKFMSRVAPDFIFKQLSRGVDRMLNQMK